MFCVYIYSGKEKYMFCRILFTLFLVFLVGNISGIYAGAMNAHIAMYKSPIAGKYRNNILRRISNKTVPKKTGAAIGLRKIAHDICALPLCIRHNKYASCSLRYYVSSKKRYTVFTTNSSDIRPFEYVKAITDKSETRRPPMILEEIRD